MSLLIAAPQVCPLLARIHNSLILPLSLYEGLPPQIPHAIPLRGLFNPLRSRSLFHLLAVIEVCGGGGGGCGGTDRIMDGGAKWKNGSEAGGRGFMFLVTRELRASASETKKGESVSQLVGRSLR